MGYSANDIIERTMVKGGIISPGETVPASIQSQVFDELNDMLESWALEKLLLVADTLESFSLTATWAEYSYGVGGEFDSARPIEIKDESFIRSEGIDYPLPLVPMDIYRRRSNKTVGARPEIMTYNPTYPLGRVYLWPTPVTADTIHFRVAKALTGFTNRTTSVDLEPGFARAIISNLVVEIAPNFGKKVSRELYFLAEQAKGIIKSANTLPIKSATCPDLVGMLSGRGSILSGPWG